tara:strand:+ start:497 stop:736 length:240 start_codon:yes stop_codon:yes gene_type:complete
MLKSILVFLLFMSTFSFSQQEVYGICPIKNSDSIPESLVYSQNRDTVNLQNYVGANPTIIVFYRGVWCPYCMRHISALK